jgi:transposase
LDLPGVQVVRQEEPGNGIRVVIIRTTDRVICPRCGHVTTKVHDTRPRVKADVPLGCHTITLVVLRRRFRCGRCAPTFTEEDPICGRRRRLTRRLRQRLGEESLHQTAQHVAAVYGVSATTVRVAQAEYATQQSTATAAPVTQLGIDDFALRKGQRYATGLHDLTRRRLFEVIEGRTSAVVQAALAQLPHPAAVQVVSMDMSGAFRAAVQEVLPDAAIVVDKFHVVARVTDAVREVWRRLSRAVEREHPLRRIGRRLLQGKERLSTQEEEALRAVLRPYPSLRRAWLLKEDFRRWYQQATPTTARLELAAWRRTVATQDDLPELQELAGMFARWQEEILNYFTFRVTQGGVEGRNNRAKALARRAYGYRSFTNYRRRLLLAG